MLESLATIASSFSDDPLVTFVIFGLLVVCSLLFADIRSTKKAGKHEQSLCNWKMNKLIGLSMRQGRIIRLLDRRGPTDTAAFEQDRREVDLDIDGILSEFNRVLSGPTTPQDWAEVNAMDVEAQK